MKTELDESAIHSAYLDSDGSLYLYDKDEKDLEGWPKSWPQHIPCVQTFLKARGIYYANPPAAPSLAEIAGLISPPSVESYSRETMDEVRAILTELSELDTGEQPCLASEAKKALTKLKTKHT